MKKTLLLLVSLLLLSMAANAAAGTVTVRLRDASDAKAIVGATAELTLVGSKSTTPAYKAISNAQGSISLAGVTYGDYNIKIHSLGYEVITRQITVSADALNLGDIKMEQAAEKLDEVIVEVNGIRASQKGDTVSFNADAFKVAKDADAEGLLAKLPGVTIVDGEVTAQGEKVKKVFVDGKEFFGEDVNSAIKNLPAETIAKIEVYNKQSDNAEFTGVDDGEGYKAINIVTKVDMRQGQFGKLYAGYGIEDKYIVGGSVNMFSGDSKITLIGLANNMNQQNFSSEDILGTSGGSRGYSRGGGGGFYVPQQRGISTVNAFGINYSDQWGKKVTFQGSYFFNNNSNENTNDTDRDYFSETNIHRLYTSTTDSDSKSNNHRLSARFDWKISDYQSLMIRPTLSFMDRTSNSTYEQLNSNGLYDGGQLISSDPLNKVDGKTTSESNGYNISNGILYRARLGKEGRTIILDGNFSMRKNDSDGYNYTLTHYYPTVEQPIAPADSLLNRHNISKGDNFSFRGSAMYTEPIAKGLQANLQYRYNYNDQPSNRKTYLLDGNGIPLSNDPDPRYSNIYASVYTTQSIGTGLNYAGKKTIANANVSYQTSTLDGDRTYPEPQAKMNASFNDVLYFGMLQHSFNKQNVFKAFLRSSTNNPSVTQLQDVVDVSNSQSVSSGNPNLNPSYEHNLYMTFNRSNLKRGSTLMFMMGGAIRDNYIADSLVQLQMDQTYTIEVPDGEDVVIRNGAQYTKPINMNGYRSLRGMVTYGMPVKWIRSNANLTAGISYQRAPSIINGLTNISSAYEYEGGAVVSSNISQNLDFTLRYNIGYNIAKNTINERNDNTYLRQTASGNAKWVFWKGFTLAANASYYKYSGISDDFTEEYCLLSASLGKKIFKNQRGEVNVSVNDILDQNKAYRRSFTDTYVQNTTDRVISRYASINFIYNLRNFGKKSSGSHSGSYEQSTPGQFRQGPPGGMGPGAGGPPMGGGGGPF